MGGPVSQQVERYKRLDEKRTREGLSPAEDQQWVEVKQQLERVSSSEEAPPSSRRMALRVPTDLDVTFQDSEGFSKAYLRNISEGGVYVETARPLEMGGRFQLKILVERPAKTLELPVEVVWVNHSPSESSGLKQGVGVAFLDLAPEHKAEIKAIVHHALDELARSSDEGSDEANAPLDDEANAGDEPAAPTTVRLSSDEANGEDRDVEPDPATVRLP